MPRKKLAPKFKYTIRKADTRGGSTLYVRYPVAGLKNAVWRKCETETQAGVDAVIEQIKQDRARELREASVPENCATFFAFWLNLIKPNISERTHASSEGIVRLFLTPAIGAFNVAAVKPIHLLNIYQQMVQKDYSAEYIKKVHRAAFSIFKTAVNLEIISDNPTARVKPPKTIPMSEKIKVLKLPEIESFRRRCRTAAHGIVFEFALETGMRPGEYLALRWSDIDFTKRLVRVSRGLVSRKKDGEGYYFKSPKTKSSVRAIRLSAQICEKLAEHRADQARRIETVRARISNYAKPSRERRKEHNRKMLENRRALDLVFPSEDFSPLRDGNLNKRYFKPIIESLGFR